MASTPPKSASPSPSPPQTPQPNPSVSSRVLGDPEITMRRFPPLSHTLQNILASVCNIGVAVLSLLFTILCILPLSIFRAFRSEENLSLAATSVEEARGFFGTRDQRKIVLIVGASRRVGFELLRLYAVEKETRIIAVSSGSDLPALRAKVSDLGDSAKAMFRFEALDLGDAGAVSEAVRHMDEEYGPLSHLYVVCGIPLHLKEHPDAWKLDPTLEMVQRNIIGTVAILLPMMERMGARRYGKMAVISSGYTTPVNMLSDVGIRAFLGTYLEYLRVLGNIVNVDVVNVSVEHEFSDGVVECEKDEKEKEKEKGRVAVKTERDVAATEAEQRMLEDLAITIWEGVEGGGVPTIGWPMRKYMLANAARASNPLVQQFQRWAHARHEA